MGKIDKKKKRLQEKIDMLQSEINESLKQKSNGMKEVDLVTKMRRIEEMQKELALLK